MAIAENIKRASDELEQVLCDASNAAEMLMLADVEGVHPWIHFHRREIERLEVAALALVSCINRGPDYAPSSWSAGCPGPCGANAHGVGAWGQRPAVEEAPRAGL